MYDSLQSLGVESTCQWKQVTVPPLFLHFYTLVHNRLKKIVFQVETFIIEYYLL